MVSEFDPGLFRQHLLRRMTEADVPQLPQGPGVVALCAAELRGWLAETRLCSQACTCCPCRGRAPAVARAPASTGPGLVAAEGSSGSGGGLTAVAAACRAAAQGAEGAGAAASAGGAGARSFPARAICGHIRRALGQVKGDVEAMLFLTFPRGSLFNDRSVEALFQRHNTRRWWVWTEWSMLLMMLLWDVSLSAPCRRTLVILFHAACAGGLIMRKAMLFASPDGPQMRRISYHAMLCAFLLGRCAVCQPLLADVTAEGMRTNRAVRIQAVSSAVGLGITNLSMVLMQQLRTVDMLLFCIANSTIFIIWIVFALQVPLSEALHATYVASIVVTAVCVRQQRDLEDLERRTFDHELLQARGMLVRNADRIGARASAAEFGAALGMLGRARRAEKLNL